MAWRKAREGEKAISRFLQAVGDGFAFEPPFSQEGFALGLDVFGCGGIDHVVVIGRDLLMQPVGRMGEQVAMLVYGAALDRRVGPERRERLIQT